MKHRLFVPVPSSGLVPHLVKRESVVSLLTNSVKGSKPLRITSVFRLAGVGRTELPLLNISKLSWITVLC
jgi:hypothetical protein